MHSRPIARRLLGLATVLLLLLLLLLSVPLAWAQQLINGSRVITGTLNAATTTGTGTAYVLTLNPAINAYVDKQCFTFKAHVTNTGPATLNINNVGAVPLRHYVGGTASTLAAGDMTNGQIIMVCWDGTAMQLVGAGGAGGTSGGGDVTSVFGRSGAVSAQAGDYSAAQVTNAESTANKSTDVALGTSPTAYPSQSAVKSYVDTGLTGKQATVTWGAGLAFSGATASVASTEPSFLTQSGTGLTAGAGQGGKMQTLATGELQYTDGAATSVTRTGFLTQSGLSWNVTPGSCTGDTNNGKLTVNASNQIICASDIGGTGGAGGGVSSVFGRTGAVVAAPGDYTASQVTNAADLTAPNIFTHVTGQSMTKLILAGSTSGTLTMQSPPIAGSNTITWPAGSTNFTGTGGAGQVVKQVAAGAALTVAALTPAEIGLGSVDNTSDATKNSAPGVLENKQVVPRSALCTPASNIITPNADTMDVCEFYVLVAPVQIANPTFTAPNPRAHQRLEVVLKSAAPQAITFGNLYDTTCGQPLPTATTGDGSTVDHFLFKFNPNSTKFCLVASSKAPAKRLVTFTSATASPTLTCASGTTDRCQLTATGTTGTITIANPTGLANDGDMLMVALLCTALHSVAWDNGFIGSPNIPLPTTNACAADTTKWTVFGVQYSTTITKWQLLAVN